MPILRAEIATYVETWNEHRIRSQRQRPNHVPGVPNQLYTDASTPRYGWSPDIEFLAQLDEAMKDVGKRLKQSDSYSVINYLDSDAYLFNKTLT
jgi:hypothetical protein